MAMDLTLIQGMEQTQATAMARAQAMARTQVMGQRQDLAMGQRRVMDTESLAVLVLPHFMVEIIGWSCMVTSQLLQSRTILVNITRAGFNLMVKILKARLMIFS